MVGKPLTITYDEPARQAARRARHHADLRVERGGRQAWPATPSGWATRSRAC
nr:hypothetical protein [Angustibacter aerolatus]